MADKMDSDRRNTSRRKRRHVLHAIGMLTPLGMCSLAGCSWSGNTAEIVIEYVLTVERPTEVSEKVRTDAPSGGGWWAVVEFDVVRGSFAAADLLRYTQVRAAEGLPPVLVEHYSARAVELISPEERFITSPETAYTLGEQARGWVYYRLPENPPVIAWDAKQMESVYDGIRLQQR